MDLRARLIGALLVACGLALCFGAVELWSAARDASSGTLWMIGRVAGACVVAVFGVGNVLAGLVIVTRPTSRV